jgi:hypothetical protein
MTSDLNLNNNDILNASRILVGGVDYIATALSYKNAAEAAQTAAETAQAAAELVYDNFDDRYLGSKASDPTLDNDGNALLDGALYYDTINTVMKFYDTSTSTWYRTTPTTSDQANIDIVAGNTTNINTVAGISSDVTTVAGISSDVTTVAADGTDIGTVATDISNVNTAATNISNINTVAGISANVTTVAGNTTNINTVATDISNVNTVAGQTTNLQNVTDNLTAIQNAATNATNAATSASNAATSETNAATSASNASTSETNAASSATAAAASAAAAEASADFFDDVYLGSKSSDPSVDNDGDALNAGDLYFNTTSNTMRVYSGSAWQDAAVDSSGFVQTTGDTMTGDLALSGADITFGDNDKAIFGAGSDLQIYHDGVTGGSYIRELGSSSLFIQGANVVIEDPDGNNMIRAADGGEAQLYHNGSQKLATTSTGVDITGTLTSDGLTVEDADGATIRIQSSDTSVDGGSLGQLEFYSNDASTGGTGVKGKIQVSDNGSSGQNYEMNFFTGYVTGGATAETKKMSIGPYGDISFYEDTGTTAKFFWDASAESLGIGTTSPLGPLHLAKSGTSDYTNMFFQNTGASGRNYQLGVGGSDTGVYAGKFYIYDSTAGQPRLSLDSSGNVGIGTLSPDSFNVDARNLVVGTGSGDQGISIYAGSASDSSIFFVDGASGTSQYRGQIRYRHGVDSMSFLTAGGFERMRIDSSGNVGIGTTSPDARLHIVGQASGSEFAALKLSNNVNADGSGVGLEFADVVDLTTTKITSLRTGTNYSLQFFTTSSSTLSEKMRITGSGDVILGQGTNISQSLVFDDTDNLSAGERHRIEFRNNGTSRYAYIGGVYSSSGGGNGTAIAFATNAGGAGPSEAMRIDSSGNLLLGTTSLNTGTLGAANQFAELAGGSTGSGTLILSRASDTDASEIGGIRFANANNADDDGLDADGKLIAGISGRLETSDSNASDDSGGHLVFYTKPEAGNYAERMRIDSSGNLLVGTTVNSIDTEGALVRASGQISACVDGNYGAVFQRKTSDGDIVLFRKDGTTVGSIGVSSTTGLEYMYIGSGAVGLLFDEYGTDGIRPFNTNGTLRDNAIDLGSSTARFDDVYATNGTIQTSDQNEKQDIAELTDAEQRVAVAAKGLLRKFRWKDAVAEKGDEARTHFGIIAQDLQAAFAAEGLDAGDYAMFIHSTWTDEETGEEKSRMGVRYSELLAFIIAAI